MQPASQIAISQSEMVKWVRCRRTWFLQYYLGYRLASENPVGTRQLGTRVHTALEAHYGYQIDPIAVLAIIYRLAIEQAPESEQELRKEHELAVIMVSGYLEWVNTEAKDAQLQVVSVEADVKVALPGVPGVLLRARMDQVVRDLQTGFLSWLDHKTADGFDSHHLLELNGQFKFYSLVQLMAAGIPIDGSPPPPGVPVVMGGKINTLRRVKRTEKSKPPYYDRDDIRYSPEVIISTLAKTRRICAEIMAAREELDYLYLRQPQLNGEWPPTLEMINEVQRSILFPNQMPRDCSWSCPFSSGLCIAMDDGSDWGRMLASGRFIQGDPYDYYERGGIASIRAELAAL
jgi:PD-(D/E)XK nuclease superfamily